MNSSLTARARHSGMTARKLAAALLFAGTMSAVVAVPAHAQESTASVRGTVTLNPGVTAEQVIAIDVETGYRRTSPVRADGSYNLASLRPARYRLEIPTSAGLRRTDEFVLAVGQNSVLDLDFTSASAEGGGDDIVVVGSRLRRMEGGEVGVNISERLIDTLPQNNRNFLAFADLAPGVAFVQADNGNARIQGGAQDSRTVNIFIDGVGQKDYVLKNGITGQDSSQGNPFPQSAIGEYRVISSNYKAEFDQVSSVAITAVTKSGTNEFHGDAFIDFTNQDLRDKTPREEYDRIDKVKTRDFQFGASLGGPIIKDKLHFFAAYEGKRNQVPVEVTPGGGIPESAFPAEYQGFFGSFNREFNEDLYFGKIDFVPTVEDLFEVSVKVRRETGVGWNGGQEASTRSTDIKNNETRALFRYERTQETWVNDFKVAYEKSRWAPTPRVFENGKRFELPATARTLLLNVGGSANYQDKGQEGWSVQNDFTFTGIENHTIKVGAKAKWVKLRTLQLNFTNPLYYYNVGLNGPGTFNDDIPYRVQFGANSGAGSPVIESDNFQFGIYAQDDWDVNDRLTLNIGLRWDYEETPSYLDFVHPQDALNAVSPSNYPNLNNANYDINDYISTGTERKPFKGAFQPRIGFSYELDETGSFVLFGGYGRSYDRNQFDFLQQEISQGSFVTRDFRFITGDAGNSCTAGPTCVPWDPIYLTPEGRAQLLARIPAGGARELRFITNDLKVPYSDQFSLGLRRRFNLFQAEVGYTHIESKDGFAYLLGNRRPDGSFFAPGTLFGSPFGFAPPGMGSIIIGTNGIETSSDAFYLKLTKTYTPSSPWSLDATWTHTLAEENRRFGEYFSLDYPSLDDYPVLRSAGVSKDRFVAAASGDLPYGFVLSGKLTLASPPFIYGTVNNYGPVVTEGKNKNPFIFGDLWALRQLDMALTKYFPFDFLYDGAQLRLRVDVLNVLNEENFTSYNGNANNITFGELNPLPGGLAIGGNPPRTFKLSAGFSF